MMTFCLVLRRCPWGERHFLASPARTDVEVRFSMKTGSPPQAIALMSEFKTFCFLYGLACLWNFLLQCRPCVWATCHIINLGFIFSVFLKNSIILDELAKNYLKKNIFRFFIHFIYGSPIYFTWVCYIVLYCIESIVIQGVFFLWPCNKWDHYSRLFSCSGPAAKSD